MNVRNLLGHEFPAIRQTYDLRDTVIYALGIGMGNYPLDPAYQKFVNTEQLQAMPTLGTVLGFPGFWIKDPKFEVDWIHVLHVGHELEITAPIPASAKIIAEMSIVDIIDKGEGKPALIVSERKVFNDIDGTLLCRIRHTTMARKDGGFGGTTTTSPSFAAVPEREPDVVCELMSSQQAPLIYQLSGDYNPLHIDPRVAETAGFERPIMHGLATFGMAAHALIRTFSALDANAIRSLQVRFSAPYYPSETLRTEFWEEADHIAFRCFAHERDVVVIDNGHATLAAKQTA